MYSIKTLNYFKITILSFFALVLSNQVAAKNFLVDTPKSYQSALKKVKPGDKIILANGIWQDFEIVFKGKGTKEKPLILTAQTKGKVILSGQSNLRLAGEYLEVSGLVFKNGFTPTNEVIAFRRNKNELAYHSRVTEVVIDNYSNPDRFESDYWVSLYGKYNRFDHNHLVGKRNKGVTLAVRLNTEESQQNYHKIDHNYFGPRPILGSNGGETLRIGTSHYSLTDSFTTVENNYFDRCDGEVEIISVKSGKNKIANNTFFESRGTLTLRHGNGNLIEGNVFKGNGVDHTGGIRIINRDQTVKNNYLEGLTGYRFGSGFTVMNGVPNSTINRYHQVVNATIENNTLIDVNHVHLAAGSDAERSAAPKDSRFTNNIFFNTNGIAPFSVFDDISGINFTDNISNTLKDNKIKSGIVALPLTLKRADNGLLYPTNEQAQAAGVSVDLVPTTKSDTGTTWYDKKEPVVAFDSGKVTNVLPGENTLFDAIKVANTGDTLLLSDGVYVEGKIISLDKTLTIKAANKHGAKIMPQRAALFVIVDNGSLSLDNLTIAGNETPDSSGNVLMRTAKWGMTVNYRLRVTNSIIENLDINHSFHFFDSGSRAFADSIVAKDNLFKNITGDIFRLNKEQDDLGIYNTEYLTIENNTFEEVNGAIVKLYRGGRDESTFGPHLKFTQNTVINSSKDKRNKSGSSIKLHGTQVTLITGNTFTGSAPILVEHTNGEPITEITNNTFNQTDLPTVIELHAPMPHKATVNHNKHNK
jgi:poly(beta-D-mannuronate) lyase